MNTGHPTEMEIQEYVLDSAGANPVQIAHIESCTHCRTEADNYRLLFSEIKEQPGAAFDFDLSSEVLKQLPEKSPLLTVDRFIVGFLVIFIGACIGIPIFLFSKLIENMLSDISSYIIYAMIGSVSIVLSLKILEMYKKFQKQMHLLNYH